MRHVFPCMLQKKRRIKSRRKKEKKTNVQCSHVRIFMSLSANQNPTFKQIFISRNVAFILVFPRKPRYRARCTRSIRNTPFEYTYLRVINNLSCGKYLKIVPSHRREAVIYLKLHFPSLLYLASGSNSYFTNDLPRISMRSTIFIVMKHFSKSPPRVIDRSMISQLREYPRDFPLPLFETNDVKGKKKPRRSTDGDSRTIYSIKKEAFEILL